MSKSPESGIRITNLKSYIETVNKLRMTYLYSIPCADDEETKEAAYHEALKNPTAQKMYFRGQSNISWPIYPNVFRENMLSCESEMIQRAYLNDPSILEKCRTPFERLTVLQHYELGTRLLDITGNALVALYFACQPKEEISDINSQSKLITTLDKEIYSEIAIKNILELIDNYNLKSINEPDGAIYFKCAYAENFNKKEIQILSFLAEQDLRNNYSIKDLLKGLVESGIISKNDTVGYEKGNYKEIIKILQSSFCVEPNFSNERLIRQNGAFLISGNVNIRKNFNLEKASGNLDSEFENEYIIIDANYKESIIKELDNYNINERSLFPELDHQLKYIQSKCKEKRNSVPEFESYEYKEQEESPSNLKTNNKPLEKFNISEYELKKYINLVDDLLSLDWKNKATTKAQIQKRIKRYLVSEKKKEKEIAEKESSEILKRIIDFKSKNLSNQAERGEIDG